MVCEIQLLTNNTLAGLQLQPHRSSKKRGGTGTGTDTGTGTGTDTGKKTATKMPTTSSNMVRGNVTSKSKQPGRRKNAALYEFLGAVTLYSFCVFLPGLLGVAVRFYEDTLGDVSGLHFAKTYRFGVETGAKSGVDSEPMLQSPSRYGDAWAESGTGWVSSWSGGKQGGSAATTTRQGGTSPDGKEGTSGKTQRRLRDSSYLNWASSYLCGSSMLFSETNLCRRQRSTITPRTGGTTTTKSSLDDGVDNDDYDKASSGIGRGALTTREWIRHMLYGRGFWSDVELIALLSVWLATTRVLLIHLLVPRYLAEPRKLAAMVHCKSSHLLSGSAYQFSPVRPVRSVRGSLRLKRSESDGGGEGEGGFVIGDDLQQQAILMPPYLPLTNDDDADVADDAGRDDRADRAHPASPRRHGNGESPPPSPSKYVRAALDSTRSSFRRALGHERAVTDGRGTAAPLLDRDDARNIFAGPRYATAVFRFLYCSASCLAAYNMFRSADFWPVQVGGRLTGGTRNCWDLSGGVALGWIDHSTGFELDRDFDRRNAALRLFFLAQGSYQLHSLCFHVMSMALLFMNGEKNREGSKDGIEGGGEGRLISMKKSMGSYVRPLLEHIVSLGLVFGAYIFSGLRRLGAVGIFTLEISSAFLQLLQMCVNAPEDSRLRNPRFLKFFHRSVVVPSYVYCRFYVLPFVVWRSAAFESHAWLEQIERAFFPWSGIIIYVFFNGMIALIFGLCLIHFRRLLFHPHLKQLCARRDMDTKGGLVEGRRLSQ